MFEGYTEPARRVIFFARYEASVMGETSIETHHLLLGIAREDRKLLARFSATASDLRAEIWAGIEPRSRIPTSVDLPLSDECKRILGFAAEESESLGHSYIGTEHLLLGILRETTCRAAGLLMARGIRLEDFREEVRGTGEPKPVSMTPPRFAGEAGLAYWLRQSFDKESPIARGHLAKAMTCAGSKQWDEARSELQIFLDAMVEGISERPQGAEVLAPMIAGLDWKRAPSEIHTGLPDAEDFRFRLHFTLLLANLLHERRKRLEG